MKIVVVGGGASGLVFASMAAQRGHEVVLLESNSRVGKKLMLTGGGRCNLFNAERNPDRYNEPDFVRKVFKECTEEEYLDVVRSFGIYTSSPDDEGRVYPVTYSAASVVDCLRFTAERAGVRTICNAHVNEIKVLPDGYAVKAGKQEYLCDKAVIAVGSRSQATITDLPRIAGRRYMTETVPSLCPLKVSNPLKGLAGVRAKCEVTLLKKGTRVASERGEVQFRDFGLSGICVLDLSSYVARERVKGYDGRFDISVDFLPDFTASELKEILVERKKAGYTDSMLFVGLLPNKVAEAVLRTVFRDDIDRLVEIVKKFVFSNADVTDFSISQVTAGGVACEFVDDGFNLPDGVIVLGEALDVDGQCGGYNLYFAFVSAIVAAKKLK